MTMRQEEAAQRRERLVRTLTDTGVLRDPAWIDAFAEVPRHVFADRFFLPRSRGRWDAVDETDRDWLSLVYADRVLVTQLDEDGSRWAAARDGQPVTGAPTSSSSQPAIMAVMLEALRVADGHRVLEIGTGTGYNAALLAHRLGAANVTTVDVDPDLVERASQRLARCGYQPVCVAADGRDGHPPGAPYDRIIATCAVSTVPTAWLRQTVEGGLVVTTLNRAIGGGLVRITALGDGRGEGRVLAEDGRFMPLRAHRGAAEVEATGTGEARKTTLRFADLVAPRSPFEFYAGLVLRDVVVYGERGLVARADGSWLRFRTEDGEHWVTQGGPRKLWDLVEAAHEEWVAADRPGRSRFGITVDADRQELWLDSPDGPHWLL